MKMKRFSAWLISAVVAATAVAVTVTGLLGSGSESASAQPGRFAGSTSGAVVAKWAQGAGVDGLRVLVSAGTGADEVAIVVGQNGARARCWTAVAAGGRVAGPFRCGAAPAPNGALSVFAQVSGAAGSITADSVSLVGLARPDVAVVEAMLADGSSKQLTLTKGTFSYTSASATDLPTVLRAYNAAGRLIGEQSINLGSGPDSG
jgi:hypothetical protein